MTFRISKLIIEGFRSFPNEMEINFPSQLAVIYGKNGRGKSTIFDAISWLFNGDIPRYQEYGDEWKRFKTTHTRSLFNPDHPSKVQCSFRNKLDNYNVLVSRDENRQIESANELKKWFPGWHESNINHLESHMLCQHQLQSIAKAKGTERLYALAPMLDLKESQESINDTKKRIKYLEQDIDELSKELNNKYLPDNKKLFDLIRNKSAEIRTDAEMLGIINVPISPVENLMKLELWREWAREVETLLTRQRSIYAEETGRLKASYNLNAYNDIAIISNEEIKSIENTISEVNEELKDVLRLSSDCNYNILELEGVVTNVQELGETYKKVEAGSITLKEQTKDMVADDIENSINDTDRQITEVREKINCLLKALHQHEAEREEVLHSNKMINELAIKRNNSNDIILKNQDWLNEHKNQINSEQVIQLKNKLEEIAANSRDKLERLASTNIKREALYQISEDGSCPLCGTEYDSLALLNQAIDSKTKLWKAQYAEFSEHIQVASEKLTKLHSLMKEKDQREQIIEQEVFSLRSTNQKINELVNKLQVILGRKISDNNEITAIQDELVKFNSEKISSIIVDIVEHRTAVDELINRELRFKEKQVMLKNNQDEIKESQNKLDQIRNELLRLAHERNINLDGSQSFEFNFDMLKFECSNRLKLVRQEQKRLQEKQGTLRKILKENEVKWIMIINGRLQDIDKTLDLIAGFYEMLRSVDLSIKKHKHEDAVKEKIKKDKDEIEETKLRLIWLREKQRENINTAIGPLSERINALFEILSGFSIWKSIKTKAYVPNQRERTNLILSPKSPGLKSNVDTNSTFMFSMGEFSVLGMAVFLAQAIEPKNIAIGDGPQLNTLLIDDPIQELDCIKDDILAYLLCDISRERQVIVSTSNIEFANRLILSSRPIWERYKGTCEVLHLDKSFENKPQVRHVAPEKWIRDQGIYLPKVNLG